MRARHVPLVVALLSAYTFGSNDVQINEVGLKGYYSPAFPAPVSFQVEVPAGVHSITADFKVLLNVRQKFGPLRVDQFSKRFDVNPGEQAQLTVPVLISAPGVSNSKLEVDVSDGRGHHIGSSSVDLDSLNRENRSHLIVIVCKDRLACDEIQTQISFSGSDDDVETKNKNLKFVTLQGPRNNWLDYVPARFVIVAAPLSDWSSEQGKSLEFYARHGGSLVLLEKECADAAFLASYRVGVPKGHVAVGRGRLYRVPSLSSKELGGLFASKNLKAIISYAWNEEIAAYPRDYSLVDPIRQQVGMSFDFPRLRWFLIWLAVYILAVGALNFMLLRRFRRLEWGWVSTTVVAVLFAIGLYIVSSANRPKQIILDDIVVHWMDSNSPNAWDSVGLRVTSPKRQDIRVSVAGDVLLTSNRPTNLNADNVDIAANITREQQLQPGWQVQLGPPIEVGQSLFRWASSDLDFQTVRTFPGTVTMRPDLKLKNGTGLRFREAIYFDFSQNLEYPIPSMAAGDEVDLAAISPSPISVRVRRPAGEYSFESNAAPPGVNPQRKGFLNLKALPYIGFNFDGHSRVFAGLSDEPVPPARVLDNEFAENKLSVTVVMLDQP